MSKGIPFLVMATNRDKVNASADAIINDVKMDLNLSQLAGNGNHAYSVVPVNLNSNQRSDNEEAISQFLKGSLPKKK